METVTSLARGRRTEFGTEYLTRSLTVLCVRWISNVKLVTNGNNSSDFKGYPLCQEESSTCMCRQSVGHHIHRHHTHIPRSKNFFRQNSRQNQPTNKTSCCVQKDAVSFSFPNVSWSRLVIDITTLVGAIVASSWEM